MAENLDHIAVTETHASRPLSVSPDGASYRQSFTLVGAKNSAEARRKVLAEPVPEEIARWRADGTIGTWVGAKVAIEIEPIFFDREHPENSIFEATRTYTAKQPEEEDDGIEWRLSMTSQTATCTAAKRATAAPGSHPFWTPLTEEEKAAGKVEGAGSPINVRRVQGRQETGGIDIAVPAFKLTFGFECSQKKWKKLRPLLLRLRRGSVNAKEFQGFAPGELLFAGFEATRINNGDDYQLNYSFDISPAEDFIAGDFTIPDAPGWSAKWSYWGTEEEVELPDQTKTTRPLCTGAYASEVYDAVDFNNFIPSGIEVE